MSRRTLLALALTSSYSLATILLVGLRVAGAIDWSWLWITSPLWLPLSVLGLVLAGLALRESID